MTVRTTHTYALLDVSPACYEEIRAKLAEAGYDHLFHEDVDGDRVATVIDMQGLALREEPVGVVHLVVGTNLIDQDESLITCTHCLQIVRAAKGVHGWSL